MKRRIGQCLLGLGSLVVAIVVAELVSRLLFEPPQSILVQGVQQEVPAGQQRLTSEGMPNEALYVHTPTGTRLKRSSRVVVKNHWLSHQENVEIRTNSHGHRHEELADKASIDFRILVLGDSITFGDYVPEDHTIPANIEQSLRRLSPPMLRGQNIQVINAGIGAINLENEFAILMATGLAVKPNFVVVCLYLNDATDSMTLTVTRVPRWVTVSRFSSVLVNQVDKLNAILRHRHRFAENQAFYEDEKEIFQQLHPIAAGDWRTDERALNGLIVQEFHDWGYAWSEGYWVTVKNVLELMADVGRNDFQLVVAFLPVRYQVQARYVRDEPQRRFHDAMTTLALYHIDLLPILRSDYERTGRDVYYDHCHMTGDGNRLVGQAIADYLVASVFTF